MNISEAIRERVFSKPGLSAIHTLYSGVKAKQQIPYLGLLGLVGKKHTDGTCAPTASSETIAASQKYWLPEYIEDRFTNCWDDLKETFFVWGLKNGVDKANLDETDFANFLQERVGDAMWEAWLRTSWFGDKNAATVTDSPAGVLTSGTDPDYFNAIDGIWKQAIAIAVADTNRRVTININSGSTYAAQSFDASGAVSVIDILEGLLYNADYRLQEAEGRVILCTKSVANAYAKYLRSQSLDASFVRIEGGYDSLQFEGIPVIGVSFFDRMINAYFNDGTKWYLPHRALMTTKENLGIGTEQESTLAEMETIYDPVTKLYHVDFGYNLDAKVIEDYMVQVAY